MFEAFALVAAVCAGPYPIATHPAGFARPNSGVPQLATYAGYPDRVADDVNRPGFNGQLWLGDAHVGPVNTSWQSAWPDPGPEYYGARDYGAVAYALVGNLVLSISPWEAQPDERLEAARNEWLVQNGYVGGVRTFMNDAALGGTQVASTEQPATRGPIVPRAIIELSPEATRFRSRMHVDAGQVRKALERLSYTGPSTVTRVVPQDEPETSVIIVITAR